MPGGAGAADDARLAVGIETPAARVPSQLPENWVIKRRRIRHCYSATRLGPGTPHFKADLTQVVETLPNGRKTETWEFELEVRQPPTHCPCRLLGRSLRAVPSAASLCFPLLPPPPPAQICRCWRQAEPFAAVRSVEDEDSWSGDGLAGATEGQIEQLAAAALDQQVLGLGRLAILGLRPADASSTATAKAGGSSSSSSGGGGGGGGRPAFPPAPKGWVVAKSKSTGKPYYYNPTTKQSSYILPGGGGGGSSKGSPRPGQKRPAPGGSGGGQSLLKKPSWAASSAPAAKPAASRAPAAVPSWASAAPAAAASGAAPAAAGALQKLSSSAGTGSGGGGSASGSADVIYSTKVDGGGAPGGAASAPKKKSASAALPMRPVAAAAAPAKPPPPVVVPALSSAVVADSLWGAAGEDGDAEFGGAALWSAASEVQPPVKGSLDGDAKAANSE